MADKSNKRILVKISIKEILENESDEILGGVLNDFDTLLLVSSGFPDEQSSRELLESLGTWIAVEAGGVPKQIVFVKKKVAVTEGLTREESNSLK